jgi:hypothetical protein
VAMRVTTEPLLQQVHLAATGPRDGRTVKGRRSGFAFSNLKESVVLTGHPTKLLHSTPPSRSLSSSPQPCFRNFVVPQMRAHQALPEFAVVGDAEV